MGTAPSADPLHGITLEGIVTALVTTYGWEELGYRINIRCFIDDPSVSSSLKFLRKTPWARKKVERLYITMVTDPRGRLTHPPTGGGGGSRARR